MNGIRVPAIALCLLWAGKITAQHPLPISVNFKHAYERHCRNYDGSPGKNYFQNEGRYTLRIRFDPDSRRLSGNEGIDYINHSPDTLRQVVFKLYPNLYQAQAMRNVQIAPEDLTTGMELQSVLLDGMPVSEKNEVVRGTNMFIKGIAIPPGQTIHFDIAYDYTLNKGSFMRTGSVDSGAFVIAYFFPRIAVYDDIDGWNEYPYAGKEEFYNDYCDFKVSIQVPGDYLVWATGDLMNKDSVYTHEVKDRLNRAENNDSIANIVTEPDWQAHRATNGHFLNTWHFQAKNVTDFAFALSNHFIWKASSVTVDPATGRRSRIDAVYNPGHKNFEPVCLYARKTVELISYKIPGVPFPYPHETIFEGLDAMEYPMMVNDRPFEGREAIEFTAHEVFHSLLPFYVGTNETKYSFLDEGFATFAEFTLPTKIDPQQPDEYDLSPIDNSAGTDQDVPVITLTPQLYGKARFSDKDLKPALGLRYVREMLGPANFYEAVRYFITLWKGKHPTPYDFFFSMNTGAGQDLNWFWKNWFFERNVPDLAFGKVGVRPSQFTVTVVRKGMGIVPIHLNVFYVDGTKDTLTRSIACWKGERMSIELRFRVRKPVSKLTLGDGYDADIDSRNNVWMPAK